MASSSAPDAPNDPACASLKSWSRAPHFPDDYEARTNLPRHDETSAYLAHLRGAVSQHRDMINKELTGRMEEDKKREAAAAAATASEGEPKGNKRKAAAVDQEALEEQNYGEEVVEED